MDKTQRLNILETTNSIRLKSVPDNEGIGWANYLGLSSLNRIHVTGRGDQVLLEGIQKELLLLSTDNSIEFYDSNRQPVLQMKFKNGNKCLCLLQQQMELFVSVDEHVLGKIIYSGQQKDEYTIYDFNGPNTYYDVIKSQLEGVSSTHSIYFTESLPMNREPFILIGDISQVDENTAAINFKDSTETNSLSVSVSNEGRALLLGLMVFMTGVAKEKVRRQIHNEAAYKASTLLLY